MKKKLSKSAYGGVHGSKYEPYVTNGESLRQITPVVIIFGLILSLIFSASNAYTGSIAGLTVAAGIPGTIIGSGLMALFVKKSNVLNTNILQGMSSGGESVASGMIYVLPAIFILGLNVSFFTGVITGVAGVLLGIGITSLVHNYLIIDGHGELIYPEATAITETLVSSDAKGDGLKIMSVGAGIAALFTALSSSILGVVNTSAQFAGDKLKWQWATDANPLLLGMGFIVGIEVAMAMFAGTILANFVIVPLIGVFAANADPSFVAWNNPALHVVDMTAADIQTTYSKYIGAGMMLAGGLIGAIKLIPVIINALKETFKNTSGNQGQTNNFGIMVLFGGVIVAFLVSILFSASVLMIVVSFVLILFFCLVFSVVSSRMTGQIGTSNLPVSGMTIASLLIVTVSFVLLGRLTGEVFWTNDSANITILLISLIIVTAISTSGGYSQTQKATYLIGGSKAGVQKVFTLAAIVGIVMTTLIIFLLKDQAVTNSQILPQANLMATLTHGILTGDLLWAIIFVGIFLALVLYLLKLPIMTVAIGFYLSMGTVTIILFGALIRVVIKKLNEKDEKQFEAKEEKGIILSSGLIAGGAITGLIGAVIAILSPEGVIYNSKLFLGDELGNVLFSSNAVAVGIIIILIVFTFLFVNKKVKVDSDK